MPIKIMTFILFAVKGVFPNDMEPMLALDNIPEVS